MSFGTGAAAAGHVWIPGACRAKNGQVAIVCQWGSEFGIRRNSEMNNPEFVLKMTPPRLPRMVHGRDGLALWAERLLESTAIEVVAPAGYGKTTLILQWRQRWMQSGVRVAWASADALDDPARFAALAQQALRGAGALPAAVEAEGNGLEMLTTILAGVAKRRLETVLVIDDAERLPEATRAGSLQYLLHNAPANLHLVLAARNPLPLLTAALKARGRYCQLAMQDLRLQPQESIQILEKRLGLRLSLDDRMRVHTAAEGWPIALQLAISAIERESDPGRAVRAFSARHDSLQEYFNESMRAAFDAPALEVLMRLAILDRFDAELAGLVHAGATEAMLKQLVNETPILFEADGVGWYRFHPLARDHLLGLLEQSQAQERVALHAKVAQWYSQHEQYHEAAAHALAAGARELALESAKRALFALGAQGKLSEAQEWLQRMPDLPCSPDPELQMAAAAVLSMSDRHAEAIALAQPIAEAVGVPPALRAAALRTLAGAAVFSDQMELLRHSVRLWREFDDAQLDPLFQLSRMNIAAFVAMHEGQPVRARESLEAGAGLGSTGMLRMAAAMRKLLVAICHLREGRPDLAEKLLGEAVGEHEQVQGRRGMLSCLLASALALALVQQGKHAEARLQLADRLDIIERQGHPENVLQAYLALVQATLATEGCAAARLILDGMEAVAARRCLPRLQVHAACWRVRTLLHEGRAVPATLLGRLQDLEAMAVEGGLQPFRQECSHEIALARTLAALAAGESGEAQRQLEAARLSALRLGLQRELCVIAFLRAAIAAQCHDPCVDAWVAEAMAKPAYAANPWIANEVRAALHGRMDEWIVETPAQEMERAPPAGSDGLDNLPVSGLLTPKEAEILGLLKQKLSNKRIAMKLGIGSETVKWHLKNLFSKLDATSREHAVDRAQVLGLLRNA